MRQSIPRLLAFLLLCVPGFLSAADRWAQLKLGMTAEETVAALGEPLIRTVGRGFELWVYDDRAEVLFYGPVIGWTTPGVGPKAGEAHDIWQSDHTGVPTPTFLSQLPRPVIKKSPFGQNKPAVVYVWLPTGGFRR